MCVSVCNLFLDTELNITQTMHEEAIRHMFLHNPYYSHTIPSTYQVIGCLLLACSVVEATLGLDCVLKEHF